MLLINRVDFVVSEESEVSETRKAILTLIELADFSVNVTISGDFEDRDTGEEIKARSAMVTDLGYVFAKILDNGFPAEIKMTDQFVVTVEGVQNVNQIWANDKFSAIAQKIAMGGKLSLSEILAMANEGATIAEIKEAIK